ncbi:MAG TPA: hypothetical protein VJT67_15015 [Longimicrobiaceae bacterium]|nr:hypothetical protein [Longimicrobiaceae bacterium]
MPSTATHATSVTFDAKTPTSRGLRRWGPLPAFDNGPWLLVRESVAGWLDTVGAAARSAPYRAAPLGACCLFIGHPRSGHSVVGSVIDAHPDAVVPHRLDAVRYIARGYSPAMLAHLAVRAARRYARSGSRMTAYAYPVAGGWQGRVRTLRVVGDQEGRMTALRLAADPGRLDRFEARFGVPVRLVHVTRNPYDNITTWAQRRFSTLERTARDYFDLCRAVATVLEHREGAGVLRVRHEALLERPEEHITALYRFLGLEVDEAQVRRCASIVYPAAHRTRHGAGWSADLIARVADEMRAFPFLDGYGWET